MKNDNRLNEPQLIMVVNWKKNVEINLKERGEGERERGDVR